MTPETKKPIGILGGTFDPIHFGHLRMALELQQILELDHVRLVPCKDPVHKDHAHASPKQRLAMLELAIKDTQHITIDPREINRSTPSYMIHTLEETRSEVADTPLCLIMGSDAFANLPTWHRWQHILELAHIIVVLRPGHDFVLDDELSLLLEQRQLTYPEGLAELPSGYVYLQTISALEISATNIRHLCHANYSPRYLLPDAVYEYIKANGLYTG